MTPNRYRLIRTIASGGMAHVYEAVAHGDQGFERRVALKRVLPEHMHDPSMKRMFLDEARIASHLHHGNIVQIFDYGVVDDSEFIAMEFVDGIDADRAVSLSRRHGAPMPEALALHIVAEIAHALSYAHECADADGNPLGIVHRDVSPQNILLSWDGDVKLSDFGIAMATQREEKTATGTVKGKLSYMPPEQALGEEVTPASDVYALGATLHHLLVGEPPGAFPDVEVLTSELSEGAAELVHSCLQRDPAARPTTSALALRAGREATKTLDRDARGALTDWLRPSRASAGKVSALDDLMGLALVAAGDGRRFTVSRERTGSGAPPTRIDAESAAHPVTRRGSNPPATPSRSEPLATLSETTEQVELPIRWTPRALVLGATLSLMVALLATAAATGVFSAGQGEDATVASPPTDRSSQDVDASATSDAPDNGTATPATTISGEPPEAPPPALEEPSQPEDSAGSTPRRSRERQRHAGRADRTRPTREPEPDPSGEPSTVEPPSALEPAYVRIPRGSSGQERVEIDGRPRGFTPSVIESATGARRIVIRDLATGSALLDTRVDLRAHHTRVSPYVVRRRSR